jgi:GrpB-like predicted nucleotidyltransferase (UPF0157 family)
MSTPRQAPVIIVEYDASWPKMFAEESARIRSVLGDKLVALEHVGSTAVPGLAAKPIIDMLAGVQSLSHAAGCIEPLRDMGYDYVPELETDLPERRYFHKGPAGARTHHLHMVEVASDFWERHLLFRDYLRGHPETAHEYARLKRKLADEFGTDREGYTRAKTPFITTVEERARSLSRD